MRNLIADELKVVSGAGGYSRPHNDHDNHHKDDDDKDKVKFDREDKDHEDKDRHNCT